MTKMFWLAQHLLLTQRCSLNFDTQNFYSVALNNRCLCSRMRCQCKHFTLISYFLSLSVTHSHQIVMDVALRFHLSRFRARAQSRMETHTAMTRLKVVRAKAIGVTVWQMESQKEWG